MKTSKPVLKIDTKTSKGGKTHSRFTSFDFEEESPKKLKRKTNKKPPKIRLKYNNGHLNPAQKSHAIDIRTNGPNDSVHNQADRKSSLDQTGDLVRTDLVQTNLVETKGVTPQRYTRWDEYDLLVRLQWNPRQLPDQLTDAFVLVKNPDVDEDLQDSYFLYHYINGVEIARNRISIDFSEERDVANLLNNFLFHKTKSILSPNEIVLNHGNISIAEENKIKSDNAQTGLVVRNSSNQQDVEKIIVQITKKIKENNRRSNKNCSLIIFGGVGAFLTGTLLVLEFNGSLSANAQNMLAIVDRSASRLFIISGFTLLGSLIASSRLGNKMLSGCREAVFCTYDAVKNLPENCNKATCKPCCCNQQNCALSNCTTICTSNPGQEKCSGLKAFFNKIAECFSKCFKKCKSNKCFSVCSSTPNRVAPPPASYVEPAQPMTSVVISALNSPTRTLNSPSSQCSQHSQQEPPRASNVLAFSNEGKSSASAQPTASAQKRADRKKVQVKGKSNIAKSRVSTRKS